MHHEGAGIRGDAGEQGRSALVVHTNGGNVDHVDKQDIDALARRMAPSEPPGIMTVRDDQSKNFVCVLASGLERPDLVTREEFDVEEIRKLFP